jgi:type IX secretion system PorP/SprF family membrane protein
MRLILLLHCFFITGWLYAQQPSLNLYPVNPLLVNPAFTGDHGRSQLGFNHKQQWLGIDNAPAVSTFQFDTRIAPHISLGLQAQRFSRGAIQSNSGSLLFAYKVLLGQQTSLNFGLAGGVVSSGINSKSNYNPSDPAISALAEGQLSPDLKFGANYQLMGLNLGITFTEMIQNRPLYNEITELNDPKFYQNYIVNFDYKFQFPASPIGLQPFVQYNQDAHFENYFEGGALIHYNELLYLGGLYRQEYGAGILAGIQIEGLKIAYGYELASQLVNTIGQGSHEIQLAYRFGKLTSASKRQKEDPQIVKEEEKTEEPVAVMDDEVVTIAANPEIKDQKEAEQADEKAEEIAPFSAEDEKPAHAVYYLGTTANELPIGFYVIVGAFQDAENARKNAVELGKQGVFSASGYNSDRNLHLVYLYRSDNLDKTKEARDRFRENKLLKDAWLLEIKGGK